MKSKEQIISDMLAVLTELDSFTVHDIIVNRPLLYNALIGKLETYCDILDDDIPEEYEERLMEYTG